MMHRYLRRDQCCHGRHRAFRRRRGSPAQGNRVVGVAIVLAGRHDGSRIRLETSSVQSTACVIRHAAAIGIACALLISLTFLPAVPGAHGKEGRKNAPCPGAEWCGIGEDIRCDASVRRRSAPQSIAVIVAVARWWSWSGVGVGKLGVDNTGLRQFLRREERHPPRFRPDQVGVRRRRHGAGPGRGRYPRSGDAPGDGAGRQ